MLNALMEVDKRRNIPMGVIGAAAAALGESVAFDVVMIVAMLSVAAEDGFVAVADSSFSDIFCGIGEVGSVSF